MPDKIKYNATGSEAESLFKGDWAIRPNNTGGGPTPSTGYYTGIDVPVGGWSIYCSGANGPVIRTASTEADLISLTNQIAGAAYTTANECLLYYATQTDKIVLNRDYEPIVTDGLVFSVDPGFTPSYPGSGNSLYELSSLNHGSLYNAPTFNTTPPSLSFDGVDAWADFPNGLLTTAGLAGTTAKTMELWFTCDSVDGTFKFLFAIGSPSTNAAFFIGRSGSTLYYGGYAGDMTIANFFANKIGTPMQLVLTFENGVAKGYWNGVEHISNNRNWSLGTGVIRLGRQVNNFNEFFNGKVFSARLYNKALTPAEVLQNFNAQKGRFGL